MKKIFLTLFMLSAVGIVIVAFKPLRIMKKDGAAPGYTGSPGDSLKNCTACHGGKAVNVSGWITSNIPSTGYVPGQTYKITTTNTEAEGTRFGFEISPQDLSGKLLGKMIITDTVQTKLVGNEKYITYTAKGVDGSGFKTWTFDWVAPPTGSGEVIFYGGYNSNFDGHKEGDKTFLSTLSVIEFGTTKISNLTPQIGSFNVFPNPVNNVVTISLELKESAKTIIDIIDITGKQISVISSEKSIGQVTKVHNTSSLPNGIYYIRVQVNGKTIKQKISVLH